MTIAELARRFDASRARVQAALEELALLAVVERSAGQSWVFLPDRDSGTTLRHSLNMRLALESAALAGPDLQIDTGDLTRLRRQTEAVLSLPPQGIDPAALAEAERAFHSFIARASGNPFLINALESHLALLEHLLPQTVASDHMARAALGDHLHILDDLERGATDTAADRLRVHLRTSHSARDWVETAFATPLMAPLNAGAAR